MISTCFPGCTGTALRGSARGSRAGDRSPCGRRGGDVQFVRLARSGSEGDVQIRFEISLRFFNDSCFFYRAHSKALMVRLEARQDGSRGILVLNNLRRSGTQDSWRTATASGLGGFSLGIDPNILCVIESLSTVLVVHE